MNRNHFIQQEFPDRLLLLEKNGGYDGGHWDLINGYITVEGSDYLWYITIGNFTDNWIETKDINRLPNASDRWFSPSDGTFSLAYYIDSVNIEEVTEPPCDCDYNGEIPGGPGIKLIARSLVKQNGQCCTQLYIMLMDDYYTCKVDWVEVYVGDEQNRRIGHRYDPFLNDFPRGVEHYIGDICFDESEKGTIKTLRFKFYRNGYEKCELFKTIIVDCPCSCDVGPEPPGMQIYLRDDISNAEKCCKIIGLKNNSECLYDISGLGIYGDQTKFNIENLTIGRTNWEQQTLSDGYFFEPPDYFDNFFPFTPGFELDIAKVCINRGTTNLPLNIKYFVKSGNNQIVCNEDALNVILNCDCCEYYDVFALPPPPPYEQPAGYCCFDIYIKRLLETNCNITRVKLYNINNPNEIFYDGPFVFTNDPEGTFLTRVCIPIDPFNNHTTLKFEFYQGGELICNNKSIELLCDNTPYPGIIVGNTPNKKDVQINNEDIAYFYSYPNPFDGITNIFYELKTASNATLALYNSLGELQRILYNDFTPIGPRRYILSFATEPSGLYWIQLRTGNSTKYLPIIYVK